MQLTRFRVIVLLILAVSVTGSSVWYLARGSPAPSRTTTVTPGSQTKFCDYMIYKDGSTYLANNGKTGDNDYSATDPTTVFQNALNNGGTVCLANGMSSTLTSPVTINTGNSLICTNLSTQTFITNVGDMFTIAAGASNVLVQGCYMRNFSIAVGSAIIHEATSGSNINVNNNFFVGSNGPVQLQSVTDSYVCGNTVQSTRTGISIRSNNRMVICNNLLLSTNDNCIDLGSLLQTTITGNVCKDTGATPTMLNCIYIDTVQGEVTITGNTCEDVVTNCIQINTITGAMTGSVTITNENCFKPGQTGGGDAGINLVGTASRPIINSTISNSFISNAGRQGILGVSVNNLAITGVTSNSNGVVSSANGYGFRCDTCQDILLSNNIFRNNTQYGVAMVTSSKIWSVQANDLRGNGVGPILLSSLSASTKPTYLINNLGYNPVGLIANPFSASGDYGPVTGGSATPTASTTYTLTGVPLWNFTSSGGTGVSITITDGSGNTVISGQATLKGVYLAEGTTVNFGAFSVAPTIKVYGE